ncbi:Ger(x)C family spore germination protein [Neobacillus vireti]|uniref:Ger(x)C family spore germination protein n=1 Tax=Neobacillus vireti TaxID=220686 RepID=UPI002FFD7078
MKFKSLVFILILMMIVSGCWDHRELSEITVVVGMAVDKSQDNKYELTVEGVNAKELSDKTASGNAPSIVFTLEGETLAELARKMNIGISKNLIYSHMKVLVISEEIFKDGMIYFFDFLERNREIRDDFNIVIARHVKAADILKVTYQTQKSSSLKLHTQLNTLVKSWGGDPDIRLRDVVQAYTSSGRRGVMTALTIHGKPEKGVSVNNMNKTTPDAMVVVDSLAIFKKDELLDFLPLEDTRNYLWLINKLDKTVLSVKCDKQRYLGVRIFNTITKSKAKVVKGKAIINLKVRGEAYLDSAQCTDDLTQIKTYEKFARKTEKEIKRTLEATIKKLQQEYKADIFGFGEILHRVNVDVNINLRRSGIRTKSLLSELK